MLLLIKITPSNETRSLLEPFLFFYITMFILTESVRLKKNPSIFVTGVCVETEQFGTWIINIQVVFRSWSARWHSRSERRWFRPTRRQTRGVVIMPSHVEVFLCAVLIKNKNSFIHAVIFRSWAASSHWFHVLYNFLVNMFIHPCGGFHELGSEVTFRKAREGDSDQRGVGPEEQWSCPHVWIFFYALYY